MEKRSMRWVKRIFFVMLLGVLAGCAAGQRDAYVDTSAWSTNYTEDYIYDFQILTADGKATGLSGIQVKEFSRGGTGSSICCALIPGVGQTITVVWRIGGRQDDESQWKTYSREVVVKGTMPKNTQEHSVLLVRFFSGHQIEAELVPGDGDFGPSNPRIDKLFSVGPRVMRQMGE